MQFEETEQTLELDMPGVLELSDQEFQTIIINMLRTLAVSRQYSRTHRQYRQRWESPRKTQKK